MAYGIQIFNSNNNLQISEDYPIMQVIKSGTIAAGLTGSGGGWTDNTTFEKNYYALVPITGLTIPAGAAIQIWIRPSSAPTGSTAATSAIYWSTYQTSAIKVYAHQTVATDYCVVGLPSYVDTLPAEDYGMEIYDTSSNVIFTSRLPLWKHTGVVLGNMTGATGSSSGTTIQSNATWSNIDYAFVNQYVPSCQRDSWDTDTAHQWSTGASSESLYMSGNGVWFRLSSGTYYMTAKFTWMEWLDIYTTPPGNGSQDTTNTSDIYLFRGNPGD